MVARLKTLLAAMLSLPLLGGACPAAPAQQAKPELLLYCGITMVNPMTEIAQLFEAQEGVRLTIAQGGSEALYQSLKISRKGDLYLAGEPSFRDAHLAEGLLGEMAIVGFNQAALVVRKGNPKQVKADPRELLRKDRAVLIGNPESGSIGAQTKRVLQAAGIFDAVAEHAAALLPDSRSLNAAFRKGEGDVLLN